MEDSPIIVAARDFLKYIAKSKRLSAATLAKRLDHIANASHTITRGQLARYSQTMPLSARRRANSRGLIKRISYARHYVAADPLDAIDQSPYFRDVIDDLRDLATTMEEAIWRFDVNGPDDAHYFLRSQQFHWEWHLRALSLYIFHLRLMRFDQKC